MKTFDHAGKKLDILQKGEILIDGKSLIDYNPPKKREELGFQHLNAPYFEEIPDFNGGEYNTLYRNDAGDVFCANETRYLDTLICWIPDCISEFEIVSRKYAVTIGTGRPIKVGQSINRILRKYQNSAKAHKEDRVVRIITEQPILFLPKSYFFPSLSIFYDTNGSITHFVFEEVYAYFP
ncbi:MAG: hypothetical protein Aureis2KO_32340 [Aureisphaera sp.]